MTACSSEEASKGINCRNIIVIKDGAEIFNNSHDEGYSRVYEYKTTNGKYIYLNEHLTYYEYNEETGIEVTLDKSIYVYSKRNSDEYHEYRYSQFVGYLKYEENYYYLKEKRTIDSEKKWSEYKYDTNPASLFGDGEPDNGRAYKCAKKGYYINNGLDGSQTYTIIRLYETDGSLERHTYTKIDKDCEISYIPM